MRKCIRCEAAMVEDLKIMSNPGVTGGCDLEIRETGMFKGVLGKIVCAVCPECGYIETYIDNPENVKKLAEKNK